MITELDHLVILVEELVEAIASYEHRQLWDRYATSRRCRIRLKGPYAGGSMLSNGMEKRWKSARIRQEGKTFFYGSRTKSSGTCLLLALSAENANGATGISRLLISVRNLAESRRGLACTWKARIRVSSFTPFLQDAIYNRTRQSYKVEEYAG